MTAVISTLVRLQGNLKITNHAKIRRNDGIETQVWELADRSVLLLTGHARTIGGKDASKIFDVRKENIPFKRILRRLKRDANLQSRQVSLCN